MIIINSTIINATAAAMITQMYHILKIDSPAKLLSVSINKNVNVACSLLFTPNYFCFCFRRTSNYLKNRE